MQNDDAAAPLVLHRRRLLQALAGAGVGSVVFQRALAAQPPEGAAVTPAMIKQAEWISGLDLSDADRQKLAAAMTEDSQDFAALRNLPLDNSAVPALVFDPTLGKEKPNVGPPEVVRQIATTPGERPGSMDDLAFSSVSTLANLLRTRKVSAVELTRLYLDRLRRYDPALQCVVHLTEKLALEQAERADREIAAGGYRGPLHGVPWGAKDLLAYPGYPTTWGAELFKDRILDVKATAAKRLEEAGAVLIAKLSLGTLAEGDHWYGGVTRNPWNPKEGSSGSSAGSACAAAAGLAGFTLGSETLGSIVSPSRRCGATGLRPTFGRVSRYGAMTLSWSMDKIGPICRSVEDCALVLGAIHGRDGLDPAAVDQPFAWPPRTDMRKLRVGYFESGRGRTPERTLKILRDLGVMLLPIRLPDDVPAWSLTLILHAEAAAAFDDVTRKKISAGLNRWPDTFRRGQFVPAVEYIRANRLRVRLMRRMEDLTAEVDLYVGGEDLALTNFTGHPTVVMPDGFEKRNGVETPSAVTFTGRLFGETDLMSVAHAYQQVAGYHLRRPPMDRLTPQSAGPALVDPS